MLVVDTLNNMDFSEAFAFVDNATTNFVDKLELDNLGNIIFPMQEGQLAPPDGCFQNDFGEHVRYNDFGEIVPANGMVPNADGVIGGVAPNEDGVIEGFNTGSAGEAA